MINYKLCVEHAKIQPGFANPSAILARSKVVYTSIHFGCACALTGDFEFDAHVTPWDKGRLADQMHHDLYGDIKDLWNTLRVFIARTDDFQKIPDLQTLCANMDAKLKYPGENLTAVLTTEKSESAESVVPEAGIEPATKGL
jgi:hypothetical protein